MNYNFFYLFIFLFFFEIILILLVNYLKLDFKWILNYSDEKPQFEKKKLTDFYKNSFDPILGWDRKKNSKGFEISNNKTFFLISSQGNRGKSNFKSTKISVFGDSFAFCKYVNDNQTWQSFLEKKISTNVKNYGVPNYGLDQSYIKYLKYSKNINSKIIIFNFVPETIARINSCWKHYREFGNIYGFKPLINIKSNKINIFNLKIKKNFTQEQIHNQLKFIKKKDIFYNLKFKKNIFKFPYSFVYFKKIFFFSKVFFNLIISKLKKNKIFYNNAVIYYYKKNIVDSHKMYNDKNLSRKLENLILFINNNLSNKKKMVIIVSPQLLDLESPYLNNYATFYKNLSKKIYCLDLTQNLINVKNYKKYYLSDIYGGHFNQKGNKFVSEIIYKFLKNKKII